MNKFYSVEVIEGVKKTIVIEASDENEAGNIVDDLLVNGQIDFDSMEARSQYFQDFEDIKEISAEQIGDKELWTSKDIDKSEM